MDEVFRKMRQFCSIFFSIPLGVNKFAKDQKLNRCLRAGYDFFASGFIPLRCQKSIHSPEGSWEGEPHGVPTESPGFLPFPPA